MNAKSRGILIAVVLVLFLSPTVGAKEVKVESDEMPAAVMDTLQVHYPTAKFLGFSKEIENGSTVFEAEMKVDGRHVDALLDSVGTFREIENEIMEAELPDAVRAALSESEYAGGKIESAERHVIPGSGDTPTYELQIELKEKNYELVYDASGRLKRSGESDDRD